MVTRTSVADRSIGGERLEAESVSGFFEGVIIFVIRESYEIAELLVSIGCDG